jgi:glutathione synthase/RimK-type ligase-like ATP-grasp enzyme
LEKIIQLAQSFKAQGGRVVDDNITKGNLGKGKWEDYQKLIKAGLSIPKTWKYESRIMNYGFKLSTKHLALSPFILKWIYGLKAKGTFLIRKEADLENLPRYLPRNELMQQEYIEADWEYKIITVGYKALPVILRFKFNKKSGRVDFSSFSVIPSESSSRACLPGRQGIPYRLKTKGSLPPAPRLWRASRSTTKSAVPDEALAKSGRDDKVSNLTQLAELAAKTLGRELAKVDILEKAGKFYVLEVNRFPGLKSFESLAKYNVFKLFVEYLQNVVNVV